jgi:hypothetical protein
MSACRTCGNDPCVNPSFCRLSRRADARLAAERRAGRLRESTAILLAQDVSFEQAWFELNDPLAHPAPRVTIEAVIESVRVRGLAALEEEKNIERLSRCNARAKPEIERRIQKLEAKGRIGVGRDAPDASTLRFMKEMEGDPAFQKIWRPAVEAFHKRRKK